MKRVKRAARTLLLAALVCMLLATAVFAAEEGSVWLKLSEEEGTAALVMTDTTVTDGVIRLTYDSNALTYESVEVEEAYVAMYAVNADEEGVVKISWVAPEAYETDGTPVSLIRVNFSGETAGTDVTLSGAACDAEGNTISLGEAPDTAALEAAIRAAESLEESKYTGESYAEVEKALAEAEKVLADVTATQEEIDEAAKALNDAIAALEPVSGGSADTGDTAMIALAAVLVVASVAGIIVLCVVNKRRRAK